jgi:hypothetical protein
MLNHAPASSNPIAQLTQIAAVDLDRLYYEILGSLPAKPLASTAITGRVRPTSALRSAFGDLATLPDVRRLPRPGIQETVIIAAALLIGISCAEARAPDNGAATVTDSVSIAGLKRPPLRSSRGIEPRAWAPVAPPL